MGAKKPTGYGNFVINGKTMQSHRVAYEDVFGAIEPGLTIDHLCKNPSCVNPWHLEPVTQAENCARRDVTNIGSHHRAKTHCPSGHAYGEKNTYIRPTGRGCRACIALNKKRYMERINAK